MDAPSKSKSQGLRFAEQQMQRHGWTEGKGLGKREDGISEAIKVKVKCDTAGVGHNSAEQFTFHWWDHVFNKTASNISVEPDQDGVKVKKVSEDDSTVSSKKPRKAMLSSNMLYGRFIKSATLTSGGEKPVEEASSSPDTGDSSEDEDLKLDLSSAAKLSDEYLMKICGGRTAHKGARHGLTMNAKLSRIEEQERAFMEKYGKKETKLRPSKSTEEFNGDDKRRNKKKQQREGNGEGDGNLSNEEAPKKKKKGDGEDSVDVLANGHDQELLPSVEEDTMTLKKKSKVPETDEDHKDDFSVEERKTRSTKKKRKVLELEESTFNGHAENSVQSTEGGDSRHEMEDREYENTEVETRKSKKKKKKSKRTEEHKLVKAEECISRSEERLSRKPKSEKWKVEKDPSVEEDEEKSRRKKKKSKRTEDREELVEAEEPTACSVEELSRKPKREKWKVEEENGEEKDPSAEDGGSRRKKKKSKRTEEREELVEAEEPTACSVEELSRKPKREKWKVEEENGEEKDPSAEDEGRSIRKMKKLVDNEERPKEEEHTKAKKKEKLKGKDRGV